MWDIFKKILNVQTKNTPASLVPPIPAGNTAPKSNQKNAQYVDQKALDQALLIVNTRLDVSNVITTVLIFALVVCFLSLLYSYFQFAITSYGDYSQAIKELDIQRYEFLDKRLKILETEKAISSSSASMQ